VGIVLDSSVIIAAERRGHTVREILEQVKAVQGEIEIVTSLRARRDPRAELRTLSMVQTLSGRAHMGRRGCQRVSLDRFTRQDTDSIGDKKG
jgi:hypothetical protein